MTQKRPLIVRAAVGVWDGLNFTRRLLLNLLVLFLLALVLIALLMPQPVLQSRSTLVLTPAGVLVEQFSSDPMERAFAEIAGEQQREVQLRDLLRAINRAATDDRIERLLIRPEQLAGGIAALREVRDALARFKASGKQVIAYANGLDQRQYLLASVADEIWLHPEGAVLMEGFSRYRLYYGEALQDRLKVDVHLFRVGEYKSAAEPYILDQPSPEAQAADLAWLGNLWERYLVEIGEARGIEPRALQASIDNAVALIEQADGSFAEMALQAGLVDALKTADEARAELLSRGVEDRSEHTFRQVDMQAYLDFLGPAELPFATGPQIAVVVAEGEITGGEQPPGTIGGESTSALLRDAREDDNVKAVVLRVDSGGGEVFPSEQIRREVELLREAGKPVVASMGDVAASGGYWIAMDADRIFASPSTITGSIGIYGLVPTIPRTLEAIGVRVGGVGTTSFAGSFDMRRPLDPQLARVIQAVIERGYADFIGKVADARGRSIEEIDEIARGRVWTGAQALELGLVDALGGVGDAIADAASRAGLSEGGYDVRYVEKPMGPFEQFVANLGEQSRVTAWLARSGLGARLLPEAVVRDVAADLGWLSRPVQGPLPVRVLAYCFCGF